MEYYRSSELSHYGLKGMKWGTRRWQYSDGRFNEDGKERYFGKNSSHRPDSVRELQSDSSKHKQYSSSVSNTSGKIRQFDREKAKRVAKKVAIGAAIVGGTVLLAYGGYKIHQVGGFKNIANNVITKYKDYSIEKAGIKSEYKQSMHNIRNEAKNRLGEIRTNTKNEFNKLKTNAKTNIKNAIDDAAFEKRMNRIDPEGKLDRQALKNALQKKDSTVSKLYSNTLKDNKLAYKLRVKGSQRRNDNVLKELASTMSTREAAEFNSGKKTLNNIRIDRLLNDHSNAKSPARIAAEYRQAHPNTKLSSKEIVESYKGKGRVNSTNGSPIRNKMPKLTLTPEHITAGAQFISEINNTIQTINQINQQNAAAVQRGSKAVDDYTNQALKTNRRR